MPDPRTERLIRYGGAFAEDLVVRARGSWLETEGGSRVLDFTAGQICATVGHDHPSVTEAIGGGIPIGAVVTSAAIEETCHERGFVHVTSHVSDPLPAAAARAVLEIVRSEDLPSRAARAGERLGAHLAELKSRHEAVGDVRGMGFCKGSSWSRTATAGGPRRRSGWPCRRSASGAGSRSTSSAAAPAAPPTACGWRRP